jgi:hypothetical protein
MISHRPPQLRQVPIPGPTFALRSWVVGTGGAPEVVPEWLRQMRQSALEHLDATVQIVRRTFGLSSLRTRTVLSETVIKTTKGRLQRGATQVNASEATQQGGVRRTEGYVLRLPVGTPIPTDGKVIITRGAERFEFEITGHDPIRSESVLLTVWIAATNGITK